MQLEPYLSFDGRCEEALNFYKSALGGSFELNRFGGSHMADQVPPERHDKIMHSTFKGDGFQFMASDGGDHYSTGNVTLSLATSDVPEGRKAFDALAQGGTVDMPFGPVPWGGSFGMLTDAFGIKWMVSAFGA